MPLLPFVTALATLALPGPAQDAEATAPEAHATDWRSFRGPNGSGVAASGGLPDDLGGEQAVEWRVKIHSGYSSPIAASGRIFLTGADRTHLFTVCLDEETGRKMWHRKIAYDGKRPGANSPAASTPATDGETVYALFHHVGLIAYDVFGEELWRNDLGAPFNIPHGLATSPVVHGGRVVVQLDQDSGSALVCLDAGTGSELWRTARDGAAHSYSTPIVTDASDGEPVLVVSGSYEVSGYSFETGERAWWITGTAWQTKAVPLVYENLAIVAAYMPLSTEFGLPPTPGTFEAALEEHDENGNGTIERSEWKHDMLHQTWFIWDRDGDDTLNAIDYAYLLTTKTEKGALYAIRLGGEGDVTETHVAWSYSDRRGLSDVISPILLGDTVFLLKDGGLLTAIDAATGDKAKSGRIGEPDQYYASPVAAGNRILTAGMSGQVSVVQAGPEWETLTTASFDMGKLWSTPALTEGRILLRSETELVALARPR